ncbi:hypothetical protein, variant [Saprolegnia diclina VS20]|uniref:Uncharacterized protein n=1 Tax=Saprolegnia diclina (strain VS20) TaxID=1156394 RepID=T0QPQ9_SAPDV|nr:hypothetical protein, variant [Saprolegnia diclina VS20]EQC35830.1 hypothetical protein, variant [Saprolegnia diclina VS20]|eukprot:XP_008610592.1 hypothetical protein, variant [Saprolegnia diclina VS20]
MTDGQRHPSPRRLYEHWGCLASPIHDDDVDGINHAFNATDTREALRPLSFWDNKVPGPGRYPVERIQTGFKPPRAVTPYKTNQSRIQKPGTPGPGQYTANLGAVYTTPPFDDLLRKAPLKDLTPQRIRIKLIEREIHEIQYHKNQVLQSLPIEKQKALVAETKTKIHTLIDEKAKLLDDVRPATTGNPTLHRSKTLGFLQGEHRFFDALDCSNTKYDTPSPGFNQDLAAHSTFIKSPALPTIPRGKRDTIVQVRQQVYITSPLQPQTVAPGHYMPGLCKPRAPQSPQVPREKAQLTLRLMNQATKTKLPERMYLNELVQERSRKRAEQNMLRDINDVRRLDEFAAPTLPASS